MIKPFGSNVLIEPVKRKAVIVMVKTEEDPYVEGQVLDVGDEVESVKIGDEIRFRPHQADEVEEEGVTYLLLDEEHILGVLT